MRTGQGAVLGPALALVALVFVAGLLAQRTTATPAPDGALDALHRDLGVELGGRGPTAPQSDATVVSTVGPVSTAFHAQLDSLRGVAQISPRDSEVALRLATLLQDAHLDAEAIGYLERVVAQTAPDRQAWLDLADSYGRLQEWDGVRSAMTRMLEAHPGDPMAAYNLGAAHANSGDADAARQWWLAAADQQEAPEVAALAESSLLRLSK